MQSSPLWNDDAFRNVHPVLPRLLRTDVAMPTVREFLFGGDRRVPKGPLPSVDPLAGWKKKPRTGLRTTWLGHSTVLIEIDGLRVLTDPVWGLRASPSQWAGPKRFQPVPVAIRSLPPLDAVVTSHDHYDHLDYTSIRALAQRDVPFVTSLGVGAHLEAWGVPAHRIIELDWWESYRLPTGVTSTSAPRMRSKPGPCSARARSCRCTGARSVSPCTRGTNRPRPCCRRARNAGRSS
jgi:hypothetical protein